MPGRPSKATVAQLIERLEKVEQNIAVMVRHPQAPVPQIKSTWSADLEMRVKRLEDRMDKMVGFLKQMHSM